MEATTVRTSAQNPTFDGIKLAGSEPLGVYIRMMFAWLLKNITFGLVWFGKMAFRFTIKPLAELFAFVMTQIILPALDYALVLSLVGGMMYLFLLLVFTC